MPFGKFFGFMLVYVLSAISFSSPTVSHDLKIFTIGTGGAAYTYHPVGGMLANAISNPPQALPCGKGGNCNLKDLIAVSVLSNGSIDNVTAISEGKINSGFVQSDIAYWMYTGTDLSGQRQPKTNLRAIASLYEEHVQLVTLKRSGIDTIQDLRGKRVAIDEPGSGTRVDAQLILDASGIYQEDFQARSLRGKDAANALRLGAIDAFFVVAGYPTDLISELANRVDIKIVPIDRAAADGLTSEYEFFISNIIPTGTYRGVEETATLSVGALWITSAEEDEELIYGVTSTLWSNSTRKLLDVGHARGKDITIDTALYGIGIPLHPGAERFYKEKGLLE